MFDIYIYIYHVLYYTEKNCMQSPSIYSSHATKITTFMSVKYMR